MTPLPSIEGYSLNVPNEGPVNHILIRMRISQAALDELRSVIEDTIEYACDKEQISGECAWTVLQCLATAKLAQLDGVVV